MVKLDYNSMVLKVNILYHNSLEISLHTGVLLLETDFLISLLQIIAIDILLGGDNAIVIALASRNLPEKQRNKAIFLGTGLAIVVRVVLTIVAVYLLNIPFLYLAGGILLLIIAYKLILEEDEELDVKAGKNLSDAVKTIVFADIAMGLDNVLAIAGAAHGNIILVVIGLLVSVPIIIWGSKIILHFMERFPVLIYIGSGVLAFTAAGMIIEEKVLHSVFADNTMLEYGLYLFLIIGVLFAGILTNSIKRKAK
jgi:YjbE family integral membrane protein